MKCEHLRTKESDTTRDNYRFVQGVETFCHKKVMGGLLDTVLVGVGQRESFVGFDVYMCGVMPMRSVVMSDHFLGDGELLLFW